MGETTLLGFGKYHDWSYGGILTENPNYVAYICSESEDVCEKQKKFLGWVKLKNSVSKRRSIFKFALK